MSRSTKGAKRWHKKQRMAKMYRDFFDDPGNRAEIDKHKLFWCIPFHPRLVRDTVLGSRASLNGFEQRSSTGDSNV